MCLAAPFLEAFAPRRARLPAPRRLAILTVPFGMLEEGFHPLAAGPGYVLPTTLAPLAPLRERFTVFSNLDHGEKGGHGATHTLLSGVRLAERAAYPEGNLTLDQRVAEELGSTTRYPSLVFWGEDTCFTRTGVRVPSVPRPSEAFRRLFVEEGEDEKRFLRASLATRASILDAVREEARALESRLGREDRAKLEEYFTAIRATETQLHSAEAWLDRAKPAVPGTAPRGIAEGDHDEPIGRSLLPIWLDLMYLALVTDSTRVVTTNVGNCN